jgi:hypothetical protein
MAGRVSHRFSMNQINHPSAFQISGLPLDPFQSLFGLSDAQLAARSIIRRNVTAENAGMPCRISLVDAVAGDTVLLLSYEHQPVASSPYHSTGPIFVRVNAEPARLEVGEVPDQVRRRLMSVRAYDDQALMIDSAVTPGTEFEAVVARFFGNEQVAYLHVHNAGPGCYSCRVDRA